MMRMNSIVLYVRSTLGLLREDDYAPTLVRLWLRDAEPSQCILESTMTSKGNRTLPYGTRARRVRRRRLRFGVISILCVGIALCALCYQLPQPSVWATSLVILLFIGGGACAIVGLTRGVASLVLSLISLGLILYVCLFLFLRYTRLDVKYSLHQLNEADIAQQG